VSGWLRALGALVVLLGLATAVVCGVLFVGDANYYEITAAYDRHPNHAIFQAEYWAASAQHWALLAAAITGLFTGVTIGSLLLGVGELLRRKPHHV
jgi:hypothetical protein